MPMKQKILNYEKVHADFWELFAGMDSASEMEEKMFNNLE